MKTKIVRCQDIERKVPKALMPKGIEKCRENAINYLEDARLIAKTGRLNHAVISLQFALEEFGKLLLIQESLNNATTDPIEINGKDFCDHNAKAEKALKLVDPSSKFRILVEGWFGDWFSVGYFPLGYWGERAINNKLRLDCAFVDFVNGNWLSDRLINPKNFQRLVDAVEQELRKV